MLNLGKKILVYGLCSMLASPFMIMPRPVQANTPAPSGDAFTVYSGGKIYPMTEEFSDVQKNIPPHELQVVVVNNTTGKIFKVFKDKTDPAAQEFLNNKDHKQVDLGTNIMLPGFIDPHGHFPAAMAILTIDLSPTPILQPGIDSVQAVRDTLLKTAEARGYFENGINWIQGYGYDDTMFEPQGHPTRQQMDEDGLDKFYVSMTHISGHMAVCNTKALSRLFDEGYLKSKLTDFLRDGGYIDKTSTALTAKVINDNGSLKYEITLSQVDPKINSDKLYLAGIQMVAYDADQHDAILAGSPKGVTGHAQLMTGLMFEAAASYATQIDYTAAAGYPEYAVKFDDGSYDMAFIPNSAENIPFASKEYISRGVTSANHGGSTSMWSTIADAQKALVKNKLPLRMVIQPRIYLNSGVDITEKTLGNHYALGWDGIDVASREIGKPSETGPKVGSDITSWYAGDYDDSGLIPNASNMGMPGEQASGTDAYTLSQSTDPKMADRLMLGTWKYNYDGSIQGYTGYLAQKGYYQKPAAVVSGAEKPFNPAGRTGDELKGTDAYVLGGTVSVNDPKYFCGGDDHYGNENSLSQGTYTTVTEAVSKYHATGQGVSLHLNGSWANEDVVWFVENAVKEHPEITDTRHTVIHAQMQALQHIQRFLGNYDQFPISTPQEVKKFSNVYSGVNAMTWKEGTQDSDLVGEDYNPVEGEYLDEFSEEAVDLRKTLSQQVDVDGKSKNLIAAQNVISSYFVDHTYYWGERHRDIFMGPGRAYNMSPMGWAVKLGHRWTFHNDTPVTPQNPLKSISIATTRLSSGQIPGGKTHAPEPLYRAGNKEIGQTWQHYETYEDAQAGTNPKEFHDFDQRITVLQGLHAVTVNSAYSSKIEDRFGSIKEGYWADFVILAQDPFELEKQGEKGLLAIADIPVVATIIADEAVFGFIPGTEEGGFVTGLESSFYAAQGAVTEVTETEAYATQDFLADTAKGIVGDEGVYLGAVQFDAQLAAAGITGVFTVQIMGNNDVVENILLTKLLPTKTLNYELAHDKAFGDGQYIITDKSYETILQPGEQLAAGKAYYVHFAITDGGDFDRDATVDGKIADPTIVTAKTTPVAPEAPAVPATEGGYSDGGCTVGTTAQYDLVVVFFAALGLLAVRVFRKREEI